MMKNEAWPVFSFTELLKPPEGWRTDCAILSTYSADLVVIVTALLALTGCDLDNRRTGSRVELVKTIEALRGRVCVLAQTGRVPIPNTFRPILKLLDKFLKTIDADEAFSSWHPKIALIRYANIEDASDHEWRVWLGSRNLTSALNWEAGLLLASQPNGKGQHIAGLAELGEALAARANLAALPAKNVGKELAKLTWECPPGSKVHRVRLFGPGLAKGFPQPPSDTDRMFVVSPFLDAKTVSAACGWEALKHVARLSPRQWSFSACYTRTIRSSTVSTTCAFNHSRTFRPKAPPLSMKKAMQTSRSLTAKKRRQPGYTQSCYSLQKESVASFGWAVRTSRNADGRGAISKSSRNCPSRERQPMASRSLSPLANASTPTPRLRKPTKMKRLLSGRESSSVADGPSSSESVMTSWK
jgi:hypothetical protein